VTVSFSLFKLFPVGYVL